MYELAVKWRNLLRYLFWPKCDVVGCRNPAYFEHYDTNAIRNKIYGCGWIYVCWEHSLEDKYEGHGAVE